MACRGRSGRAPCWVGNALARLALALPTCQALPSRRAARGPVSNFPPLRFCAAYHDKSNFEGTGENVVSCDYNLPPGPGKVCRVNMQNMGACNKENFYNYRKGGPCIFLKLNKVPGQTTKGLFWKSLSDVVTNRSRFSSVLDLRLDPRVLQHLRETAQEHARGPQGHRPQERAQGQGMTSLGPAVLVSPRARL